MTPELVAKYLRLNRATGHVVEFLGQDPSTMSAADKAYYEEATKEALAELDAADEDLQKAIYALEKI